MSATGDLLMLVRVSASLVVVVVLALLVARFARRAGMRGPGVGLTVLDRTGISREASVAVIEVAGRTLVLGVTAREVRLLVEIADGRAIGSGAGPLPPAASGPLRLEATAASPATPPPMPMPMPASAPMLARTIPASPGSLVASSTASGVVPTRSPAARVPARSGRPDDQAAADRGGRHSAPREARRRVAMPPNQRSTSGVLNPRTWQQGIEALRDLTARRG